MELPILANWKGESYDSILVIINWLIKILYYKLVKFPINARRLVEIILNVVVWNHDLPNSLMSDKGSLFTSKFWSSLCYFLSIKQKLSSAFHLQTDGQTKCWNKMMEEYLWVFINFKQDNWARLLLMVKFAYNNAKNLSTGHMPFKLNFGYHLQMSYKEKVNFCPKLKSAGKLSVKLRKLMIVCRENLHHVQNLQNLANDKGVKPKSCQGDNLVGGRKMVY